MVWYDYIKIIISEDLILYTIILQESINLVYFFIKYKPNRVMLYFKKKIMDSLIELINFILLLFSNCSVQCTLYDRNFNR